MPFQRNVRLFYAINFFMDFRLYGPVAAIYFAQVSGSYVLGLSVFSIIMLTAAAFELPTALLSDLAGRKGTLLMGAAAGAASVTLYALGGSFPVLAAGAALEGLSRAFYSGNNEALLYDSLAVSGREGDFSQYLGRTSAMFQAALAGSAVLGGLLAQRALPLALWLSAVAQCGVLATAIFITEPPRRRPAETNPYAHLLEALRHFSENPRLRLLGIAAIIRFGVEEAAFQFQVVFFEQLWPLWAIGLGRALSHVAAFFSFTWSGQAIRRFGAYPLLLAENVANRALHLLALLSPGPASPALIAGGSLFFGVGVVAQSSLLQELFTDEQRATMGSLTTLAGSAFFAAFAVGLGYIGDTLGPVPALLAAQAVMVVVLVLHAYLLCSARPVGQAPAE